MSFFYAVFARVKFSYLGFLILYHLAADGAGLTGGQVTVVTVGQVNAHFLCSLHLEAIHSLASLRDVDLIVILVAHSHSLLFAFFGKREHFPKKVFSFRNPSLTKAESCISGE